MSAEFENAPSFRQFLQMVTWLTLDCLHSINHCTWLGDLMLLSIFVNQWLCNLVLLFSNYEALRVEAGLYRA